MTESCSSANTEAPTIGPDKVLMPPSSTITRPSMERPMLIVSGEIEPLAKAKMPAGHPANRAGDGEAEPLHAFSRRCRSPRPAAASRGPRAWRSRTARTKSAAAARSRRRRSASVSRKERRKLVERRGRPDAEHAVGAARDLLPLEHDRPDDLREGERQHGKIDAGQPHREPAEQERAERGARAAPRRARSPSAPRAISPAAPRHRRRGRNRRRGRTNACRRAP